MASNGAIRVELGKPQPKQEEFVTATTRFVAFGGARGGGKSWAVRFKAIMLAVYNPGVRMLLLRRTYSELKENHILPLQAQLGGVARYTETDKAFTFVNGSRLKMGYLAAESDVLQYQGQEYDVIFLEEATQFTEWAFKVLTACLRGANNHPKRMYLTCNPGGVGHMWVKRLFVTRQYEPTENPADYTFIQSLVFDNKILLEADPEYVKMLENLPHNMREAWLHGNWDVFQGQYFGEFRHDVHVCDPFPVSPSWRIYRTIDYGLDMLACLWVAVDPERGVWVIKELHRSDLTISTAAKAINDMTSETVYATLAPPDLWNRSQETGKSKEILFAEAGLNLQQSSNDREAGWLSIKELLKLRADGTPQLKIFRNCANLINYLPQLQHDEKKPTDCATEPHIITHICDALRGFAISWTRPAPREKQDAVTETEQMINRLFNRSAKKGGFWH